MKTFITLIFLAIISCTAITALNTPGYSQDRSTFADTPSLWDWADCGSHDDGVVIELLILSPDAPQAGKNVTVKMQGFVRQTIKKGAYAVLQVKFGLIQLTRGTFDICEEISRHNTTPDIQCPIATGNITVEKTMVLPSQIPQGNYAVRIEAFAEDDHPLFCLGLFFHFPRRRLSKDYVVA